MKKNYFLLSMFFLCLLYSCKRQKTYLSKPFFNSDRKHIGDSIFIGTYINKIIFIDSSYEIDSILFTRYNNFSNNLQAVETFKKGKNVFENKYYYENGNLKRYRFIDEDNANYYYERLYDDNGSFVRANGYLFFQGFIVDTISNNFDILKGSTIDYRIYYPNPPDCITKVYIKNDDGSIYDVFSKSTFLNFLQTVYQDNNQEGTYKVNIFLELQDKSIDTIVHYNREIIYRVVNLTGADMQKRQ